MQHGCQFGSSRVWHLPAHPGSQKHFGLPASLPSYAKVQPEAIVYDDDKIRHVANVYTAVHDRGGEITAFHYTKEDANVKAFDYDSKKDVDKRWRKLTKTLEEVLQ